MAVSGQANGQPLPPRKHSPFEAFILLAKGTWQTLLFVFARVR
jgi:hypothetical protein